MDKSFPLKTDQLFVGDAPDWTNTAVLNYATRKFYFYADGYFEAARVLVQNLANDKGTIDTLIYPIVFLYRQYIELRLKQMISGLTFCNNGNRTFPQTHRIDRLWQVFLEEYRQAGNEANDEAFKNTQRLILEFASLDPSSMAFRYPVDDGNKGIAISHINIRNLGDVMERLEHFLDCLTEQIVHYEDIASSMYRD